MLMACTCAHVLLLSTDPVLRRRQWLAHAVYSGQPEIVVQYVQNGSCRARRVPEAISYSLWRVPLLAVWARQVCLRYCAGSDGLRAQHDG